MKNIQTPFLKILLLSGAIFSYQFALADYVPAQLTRGDSLFAKKQYTQSFELYESLLQSGRYSPAMLLKMAYIQEGLGSIGLSLYYLNLYYLASGDEQTLTKMEELAEKNSLEGYEHTETARILFLIKKYNQYVSAALASLVLLLVGVHYKRKRNESRTLATAIPVVVVILLLAIQVNISIDSPTAIVTNSNTYLMSGPSAGANVVKLIKEGHKLKIKDKKDVWLKVEWLDKDVYIKEQNVLPVTL
jgi:tetratricopeptide (TPR) repeat protein